MINRFSLHPHEATEKAQEIRKKVLNMNYKAGQGHTGADLSEADILASMYFRLLRYRISAEVVNVSSIRPLDREGIIKSVRKTGRALTVEEHGIHSGVGSLVSEIVAEEGLCCRVKRIGFMEGKFAIPGPRDEMRAHINIDAEGIVKAALAITKK